MSKEMIVSVNGREKKIAIIENGLVTEFYIERGEDQEGIVGNIYKGRVMRVLPGMQSAFVDIGLDRDAFLYVSDFFEDEEIVDGNQPDKQLSAPEPRDITPPRDAVSTRESNAPPRDNSSRRDSPRESSRAAAPRRDSRQGSRDEATRPPRPAPSPRDVNPNPPRGNDAFDLEGQRPAANTSDITATPPSSSANEAFESGSNYGEADYQKAEREKSAPDTSATSERNTGKRSKRHDTPRQLPPDAFDTPFVAAAESFERVVDEEEQNAEDGSMLKDAMLQERLTNQIRRVEFDMEATSSAEVGALLGNGDTRESSGSFERISDDEATESVTPSRAAKKSNTPVVSLANADKFDESASNLASTSAGNQSFERISDDETMPAANTDVTADASATTSKSRSSSSRRGGRSRRAATTDAPQAIETTVEATPIAAAEGDSPTATGNDETPSAATTEQPKGRRGGSSAPRKSAATKTADEGSSRRGRGSRRTAATDTANEATQEAVANAPEDADAATSAPMEDSEASLRANTARGEFATRRRRRGGRRPAGQTDTPSESGDAEVDNGNVTDEGDNMTPQLFDDSATPDAMMDDVSTDDAFANVATPSGDELFAPDADIEDDDDIPSSPVANPSPTTPSPLPEANRARQGRSGGGRNDRGDRNSNDRNDRNRDGRGGGGRPAPPVISDMLREGQEIIVQIAKEPISQKGARITSHIALPGRYLVYMPTVEHCGVSRKIESDSERQRLRKMIAAIRKEEDVPSGGFIVRTAGTNITDQDLREDARYLVRTWRDIKRNSERTKAPSIVHQDLDLVQRILRDQLSEEFTAIRVDSEDEYLACVEFINRIQPRMVNRVKLYTRDEPIMDAYGVQAEIEKAIKPRVWLRSGGYLVINQTEALVAIDVNTGKFVGRGGNRLEDTITKTNMEAVDEIARQIRLRDLGGIIVLDLIDMEERRNRARVMDALQHALQDDKSPTKVLSFNDFGLVIMTRKRVKQSLERTLCAPCSYCQGAGLIKSPQTIAYEILDEARRLARGMENDIKATTLRIHTEVARALRSTEADVLREIEAFLGAVDITTDDHIHQEQFDFAFV